LNPFLTLTPRYLRTQFQIICVSDRRDYLLTYLLTPWCRILFEKLIVTRLVKKYPAFLRNPKVHHRVHKSLPLDPILSQPIPVRPTDPYLPKVHLNIILPPTPRSSQWSLAFGPPNQNHVSTSPLPHAWHMSSPPHPPWFNYPNNIRRRYRSWSSSLCNFLHDPSSSLLGPNIFLNTLFSKTLSLCSYPKVRDQVSHPYSTTDKITVLYILIFRFFDIRREDKRFWTEW
jgi:hypothetical protein